eukprot:CAMPEP_0180143756 /NCGR_PEP_ID=MMETSP0986-20121125/16461_1 /TAXON_ID=697907 /ORGANISM="non described non described, Strain CCMP2293" /LENGTH=60 /DNA_ID=CAMNT_0022087397 /DNA_START=271 /DNA_END=453 /DNA_ORIENTATION=-
MAGAILAWASEAGMEEDGASSATHPPADPSVCRHPVVLPYLDCKHAHAEIGPHRDPLTGP